MEALISPCKKCGCREDRKICFRRCELLEEYRKKVNFQWPVSELDIFFDSGHKRAIPVSRYIVEQKY